MKSPGPGTGGETRWFFREKGKEAQEGYKHGVRGNACEKFSVGSGPGAGKRDV